MTTLTTLAAKGFTLQAVFEVDTLPSWVSEPIRDAGLDRTRYQRLVMLGQAGPRLWDTVESERFAAEHRFDEFSRRCVAALVDSMGTPAHEVLYPGEVTLPLGRMAELAGWGRASPLGLTINDEYGLWLAHRIVFLIDAPLETRRLTSSHPCDDCADTPCVSACPVGAVSAETGFDVVACSEFRIGDRSPCADKCLARLACPIGTEHVYGPEQMAYHYAAGLDSIKTWYESRGEDPRT